MKNHTISIEKTDNPAIVKFVSNEMLTHSPGGSFQYDNIDDATDSPLAQALFHIPFVSKVLITANFIAIEKFDIVAWEDVQETLREQLEKHLSSNKPLVQKQNTVIEVYAESTPNPNVLRFGTNKKLVNQGYEYKEAPETNDAPLATALFQFAFIKEVYIAENYIAITKNDVVEWAAINNALRAFIKEYLEEGKTIVVESVRKAPENLTDLEAQISALLEQHIKPAVAADGGNIAFHSYDEQAKRVHVLLQGACSGCPSSTITLKNGIETLLKEMLPGKINEVVAV